MHYVANCLILEPLDWLLCYLCLENMSPLYIIILSHQLK